MGDASESGGRGGSSRGGQPWKVDKYPKDLLQRLITTSSGNGKLGFVKREEEQVEISDELELNLGLSLGGRFGVDKPHSNKLIRSSSIATTLPVIRDEDVSVAAQSSYPTIVRTSSLPAETEEEWRKRKELQTLRRLEAKRRRWEKQKGTNPNSNSNTNPNLSKEGMCLERSLEDDRREVEGSGGINLGDKQYMISALANYKSGSWVGQPFGLPNWAKRGGDGGADLSGKGKSAGDGLLRANSGFRQQQKQRDSPGSMESQGGSSSGVSEFESNSIQGTSSIGEAKSPGGSHSQQDKNNQESLADPSKPQSTKTSSSGSAENPSKRPDSRNKGKEVSGNGMSNMPCVFTTGDGPNGRRIDGILYKYGKGEEVRIMCVCHGIFLSPAEFVKHSGGTDVDHPLRHIVVNTSAASFS